jgi:hypothetical protein
VSDYVVQIPKRLIRVTQVESLQLRKLDLRNCSSCVINFCETDFAEPFPMLYLGEQIRSLVSRSPGTYFTLRTCNTSFRGYADHIGYFRYLGFDRGNPTNSSSSAYRYLPVTVYSIPELRAAAKSRSVPFGLEVAQLSSGLAEILCQCADGYLHDLFEYTVREIVRNCVEHSRGSRLVLAGQYWPLRGDAEIVVLDDGVGIAENLYENEYVDCRTNIEALKCALLPGISSVSLRERVEQDDKWGNSGFGLYVTSRICSESGSFRLISGSNGLTLANGVQTEHPWEFQGTCVQMKFRVEKNLNQIERIQEIIREGEEQRASIGTDFPVAASVASKMFASNFIKIAQ